MSAEAVELAPAPVELGELAAALAAFQAEMPTVPKSHTAKVQTQSGPGYSYTYADLADVTEAAMPILARHGLSFTTLPGNGELRGMLLHSSGQSLTASLPIGGNNPQALGSSLTYMRRYLLGCMTGIVTDDDDDGKLAGQRKPRQQAAQRPPAPPEPSMGVDTRTEAPRRRTPVQRPPAKRLPEPPRMPPATIEHPAPDGSVDVPLPDGADTGQRAAPGDVPVAPPAEPDRLAGTKLRGIMAGFRDLGLDSPDHRLLRLSIISAMVNRPVETTATLTEAEGSRVLTGLSGLKDGSLTYEATDDGEVAVFAVEP